MSAQIESEISLIVKEETGEVIGAVFNPATAEGYIKEHRGQKLALSSVKLLDRSAVSLAMANVELSVANMEKKHAKVQDRYDKITKILKAAQKNPTICAMRREVRALDFLLIELGIELL